MPHGWVPRIRPLKVSRTHSWIQKHCTENTSHHIPPACRYRLSNRSCSQQRTSLEHTHKHTKSTTIPTQHTQHAALNASIQSSTIRAHLICCQAQTLSGAQKRMPHAPHSHLARQPECQLTPRHPATKSVCCCSSTHTPNSHQHLQPCEHTKQRRWRAQHEVRQWSCKRQCRVTAAHKCQFCAIAYMPNRPKQNPTRITHDACLRKTKEK